MKMRFSVLLLTIAAATSIVCEGVALAADGMEPTPGPAPATGEQLQPDLMNAPVLPSTGQPDAPLPPLQPAPQPQPQPQPQSQPQPQPAPQPQVAHAAIGERDVADDSARSPLLKPWDVDARAGFRTTPLLQYGGIGASADAGMRKIGPGTLALGGGLDYLLCGTTCNSQPLSFTQRQVSLEARVSYHFAPPRTRHVDFYPLLTAGFMVSRSSISVGGSEYRASDTAPSVGFGAGASYFFTDRIFVAVEARFRYAAGSYSYELASGNARAFDRSGIDTWSASTVDTSGAIGARF